MSILKTVMYSGKLSRENTFVDFTIFFHYYLKARWTVGSTSKQSTQAFPAKSYFSNYPRKFSPSKDFHNVVPGLKKKIMTTIGSSTYFIHALVCGGHCDHVIDS